MYSVGDSISKLTIRLNSPDDHKTSRRKDQSTWP